MTTRLTPAERQLRALTEEEWQQQVTQLAEAHGYLWAHFRAARTTRGWRVPVEGPCGQGFPDLVLFGRGRTIYAELKREKDTTDPKTAAQQAWVQEMIRERGGGEVYQWRPSQLDEVIRVLQEAQE